MSVIVQMSCIYVKICWVTVMVYILNHVIKHFSSSVPQCVRHCCWVCIFVLCLCSQCVQCCERTTIRHLYSEYSTDYNRAGHPYQFPCRAQHVRVRVCVRVSVYLVQKRRENQTKTKGERCWILQRSSILNVCVCVCRSKHRMFSEGVLMLFVCRMFGMRQWISTSRFPLWHNIQLHKC